MSGRARLAVLAASLVVVAPGLAACSDDDSPSGNAGTSSLPAPMPATVLEGFDGSPAVDLAAIDRPTVVNLWASWCGPCKEEMPVLQEFAEKYAGRVDVIGVDFQDPQYEKAKELVADSGVTYTLARDVDGDLDRLGPFPHVRGLPFMAFVDADGQMVASRFVAIDELSELEELVQEHLGLPKEGA